MTVKDNVGISGLPFTTGNPALLDNVSESSEQLVLQLEGAGAVIFGTTNLPLFGALFFPKFYRELERKQ
jgi:Asp-tRNA(Asn)/Glu-tRNA(Gln) amidotransferase A subunit family amidase